MKTVKTGSDAADEGQSLVYTSLLHSAHGLQFMSNVLSGFTVLASCNAFSFLQEIINEYRTPPPFLICLPTDLGQYC